MGLFDQTFQKHIQDELLSRTSRETVQNVLIPHVRVTSLIEGTLNDFGLVDPLLHGFTLGNVDISKTPSIDDYFNTTGQGTAIGLTYTGVGNTAVQVKLKDAGNKKLPPPGITNVSISTQSTGGFIFKATVQLKFYGKEQYDFLYQTMMRPGNPIAIEYGHTRMQENQKDLRFFQALTQGLIDDFRSNLRDNKSLKSYGNSGRIMGLVSNFSVKLNEQNEYEAEIELINALEFLFTISPEDTFLNYGPTQGEVKRLSKSIRSNFGWESGENYDPKYDNIFKQVLKDAVERPPTTNAQEAGADTPTPDWRKYILVPYGIGVKNQSDVVTTAESDVATTTVEMAMTANAMENSGDVYISLEYFLSKLLNNILKTSYYDREGGCASALARKRNIESGGAVADVTWVELDSDRIEFTTDEWAAQGNFDLIGSLSANSELESAEVAEVELDTTQPVNPVGFWKNLRSVNIKDVIINNVNLYGNPRTFAGAATDYDVAFLSSYFYETHHESYVDKFGEAYEDDAIQLMFKYNQNWAEEHKVVYKQSPGDDQRPRTNFEGIFVNYEKVRSAFIGSRSVGEAIQKVLNMVNAATTGVLKLKMRYIKSIDVSRAATTTDQLELVLVNRIKIYDENVLPSKKEVESSVPPYKFFEGNVSEAMSYNFDFSLPGSVAATVMANTFEPDEMSAAGGEPEKKALISYGYALDSNDPPTGLALRSLVNLNNSGASAEGIKCPPTAGGEVDLKTSEDMERDDFYRQILGYKEFDPPKMKEKAIRNGLYNVIPSAGKINIKLQGLDGWRFGDMFTVHNVLPRPFDKNNIFMVTGYKHDISPQGWFTEVDGTMIASIPDNIKEIQAILLDAADGPAAGHYWEQQSDGLTIGKR